MTEAERVESFATFVIAAPKPHVLETYAHVVTPAFMPGWPCSGNP